MRIFDTSGLTLMEIIVVVIIIATAAAFTLPNFTTPIEKANALNARNNLLAIYSAQQNYNNNNGGNQTYQTLADLSHINTAFSLNIVDDGNYAYSCTASSLTCTATRSTGAPVFTLSLGKAINIGSTGIQNPTCSTGNPWCP